MNGRALGLGKIEKVARPDGRTIYRGVWTNAEGRRCRRVLSTDLRVAERVLVDQIKRRDLEVAGLATEDGMQTHLSELRTQYLADLGTYAKAKQVDRIGFVTEKFIAFAGDVRVRDLKPTAILRFRQQRLQEDAAPRTVNLEVGGLKGMLNWALKAGLIGRNPVAHISPLPAGRANEKRPRRALEPEEIDRFLLAAEDADRESEEHLGRRPGQADRYGVAVRVPQAPLWRTLLFTGARFGELTATTWSDFDPVKRTLRLRAETTKSKKMRVIPLLDAVVADLLCLKASRGRPSPGDVIFLGPAGKPLTGNETRTRWRFRQVLNRAGIPVVDELGRHVVIHSTRHTFGTELARAGVPLADTQALLGHSDPKLTANIYTHLRTEDLRGAVEKLVPPGPKPSVQRA